MSIDPCPYQVDPARQTSSTDTASANALPNVLHFSSQHELDSTYKAMLCHGIDCLWHKTRLLYIKNSLYEVSTLPKMDSQQLVCNSLGPATQTSEPLLTAVRA